ncbi:MAG: hypothetical protein CM1200mP24_01970 [Gammaproteobacteria bacterium]|nr:MAG: hypothetical protein CM1200mP24_01970 [Gammaproteobacteria bacterium]
MVKREGIGAKLTRAFVLQVMAISAAVFAGIYITNTIVQDSLVQEALDSEPTALLEVIRYQSDPKFTRYQKFLRGYIAIGEDYSKFSPLPWSNMYLEAIELNTMEHNPFCI